MTRPRVAFWLSIPAPHIEERLNAADAFVFPTLGDPWGLAVDEAMAASLPIISTSTAGEIQDHVQEGVNGFIVPPADSTALLHRMQLLAQDAALRERMGRVSARKIAGRTPEQRAKDWAGLLECVLSRPPRGRAQTGRRGRGFGERDAWTIHGERRAAS